MSLQATIIRDILQAAAPSTGGYETICQLTGINPEEISCSENMLEWEKSVLIWNPLMEQTGDELIGLHLGMEVNLSMLGMVGFLMQSSKNLEQAFKNYCFYSPMIVPMVEFKYIERKAVHFEMHQNKLWQHKYPETARQAMDYATAAIVTFLRTLSGKMIRPISVSSEYPKRNPAEYERLLGSKIHFNAPVNKIVLALTDMQSAVITSDNSLFQLFNSILSQKKAALANLSCSENLRQILFMQFKGQIPAIDEAAAAMSMSPRSLQRKLLEENTSFRTIANEVKRQLALELIRNPGAKLSEVSNVLGYADATSFRRAFKNWTKETPKATRQKMKSS
ncbi:AraC family transcriptional regulator [Segetibacter sp. 3557_3]|uniref:AraC family transcriptional regulator n=1 Tax=Segetibacter sp. 3557_3 TaxID=2547429 RepID=UPI0010588659|nr:AraC family transcriptional regulator [Segetibacter sp. 3557_3]TDH24621.1 AraC family transcriptional regulator [Segetibacter sp. 3557_3]